MSLSRSWAAAWLVGFLCVAGCGGGDKPTLYPVRGKVMNGSSPAEGASVVFKPVTANAQLNNPTGVVAADGTFTLNTYPHGDGAPAGEYVVLVEWFPPNARDTNNPKNKLPEKYAFADKTPLPKVTVKPGANELEPFVVTAK